MAITYIPKLRDYSWFVGHCWVSAARRSRLLVPTLLICCLVVALPLISKPMSAASAIINYAVILISAVPIILLLFVLALCLFVRCQTGRSVFRKQEIIFDDTNIFVDGGYSRMEIRWDEVCTLERTKSYLLLRFHEFGALIIPRRAFGGDGGWQLFCSQCEQRVQTS